MKAIQLKVELLEKENIKIREIIVSKKTTYADLHEVIQVVFNLDGVEAYAFKVGEKWIRLDRSGSVDKTLIRMKEEDVFEYFYDIVETLHFKITVMKIVDTDNVPVCINAIGNQLHEKRIIPDITPFDEKWVKESLLAFREDNFEEKVKEQLERLVAIRYFQDYMHNQIMEIHLPQHKVVYMACDANQDVVLNFHINDMKLMEYMDVYPGAPTQSMIKYHDCIECAMYRLTRYDDECDFKVGNYGVMITHANVFNESEEVYKMYRHVYVEALKRYVDTIEYCAKHNMKFEEGMMISVNKKIQRIKGSMKIYPPDYQMADLMDHLENVCPRTDKSVEVDVLTLMENEKLHTLCIVGTKENGYIEKEVFNTSTKTINKTIINLLVERWKEIGIDSEILVRDTNLKREIGFWSAPFDIECNYSILEDLDDVYLHDNHYKQLDELDTELLLMDLLEELGIDFEDFKSIEIDEKGIKKIITKKDKKYS